MIGEPYKAYVWLGTAGTVRRIVPTDRGELNVDEFAQIIGIKRSAANRRLTKYPWNDPRVTEAPGLSTEERGKRTKSITEGMQKADEQRRLKASWGGLSGKDREHRLAMIPGPTEYEVRL